MFCKYTFSQEAVAGSYCCKVIGSVLLFYYNRAPPRVFSCSNFFLQFSLKHFLTFLSFRRRSLIYLGELEHLYFSAIISSCCKNNGAIFINIEMLLVLLQIYTFILYIIPNMWAEMKLKLEII